MLKLPVYLDYNATTPCDPQVLEAMLPYFSDKFGNAASRTHVFGWQAEEAVDHAREQVAALIGAEQQEIIFTSGSTEGCNTALKGVFTMYAAKGNHIITCVTEHKAVIDTCHYLEKSGAEITWLPVNSDGLIDLQQLEASIRPTTILIAIMYANNETGVIQPIPEISAIARRHEVIFFSDATQAVGKIPVNVQEDGIDLLTLSAHKIYGPKGAGALYVRRKNPRVKLTPLFHGGGHERGVRSGTLNVPGIVGLGMASELCAREIRSNSLKISELRDKLEKAMREIEDCSVNGSTEHRLPHVTNISFRGADGNTLISSLHRDLAVSSGSACTSASPEPSYVLKAMGVPDERAYSSIRFSLGRFTTAEEVDFAIDVLRGVVQEQGRGSVE